MNSLWQDVRYALRMLGRRPGFTVVAVLTLALGIGATTAIFSVVHSVLLRPLAYSEPDRLIALFEDDVARGEHRTPTSPANFMDWRAGAASVMDMTAATPWAPVLTGDDAAAVRLEGLRATSSLFRLLNVAPLHGSVFQPAESELDPERVVILGYPLWQRHFGGDVAVIGTTVTLDGETFRILGVMPEGFEFPPFWATGAEFWVPLQFPANLDERRGGKYLRVFGRLRPGRTVADARAEMVAVARRLEADFPSANRGIGVNVEPLNEPVVGGVRRGLLVLFGAVGFVLLIACVNISNLLLARAASRTRETAIRAALGAGRNRLVRQWITESLVLSVVGGAAGILLAFWILELMLRLDPKHLPRIGEVGLSAPVFLFTVVLSLVAGTLFGLLPAWQVAGASPKDFLSEGGRSVTSGSSRRLRGALVVIEVAVALVLTVGAGLMARSLYALQTLDPGFDRDGIVTLTLSFRGPEFRDPVPQDELLRQVRHATADLPGVREVGMINHLHIGGDVWRTVYLAEGAPVPPRGSEPRAIFRIASPGYFRAAGIPLLEGRFFTEEDRRDSSAVAVVNQAMAKRLWPGEGPVGRRIQGGGLPTVEPWVTVVGVAGDARQWDLTEEVRPEMYFPYAQNPAPWHQQTSLVVRTSGAATAVSAAIREQVRRIHPGVPVTQVRTMSELLSDNIWQPRFNSALTLMFALLALALAAVGIYGVISHSVTQRFREMGIRVALGASPKTVFRLVLGEGMGTALIGVGFGAIASMAMVRLLESLLFGVNATDPLTFVAATLFLLLVALLACVIPARRAANVDPMVALRYE